MEKNNIISNLISDYQKRKLEELQQVEQYYRDLRKYELENNIPTISRETYDKYYKQVRFLFDSLMKLSFRPIKVHKDLRKNNSNRPKVYAVTHVGRYDIEASLITRNEQAVYLWGDPGKLYLSFEKKIIDRVGAIFIDTDHRDDCHVGLQTMIKHEKNNINTQIYPEGAWNVLPNKVVMRLYDGTVIAAIEGEADIVPVAIQEYGRKLYVSYGEEIDTSKMTLDDVKEETAKLRDTLATLKWELIENYSGKKTQIDDAVYTVKRSRLPKNAYERFIRSIMKNTDNGYGLKEIEETRYKDKRNPEPDDVFNPIYENTEIKKETAFMAKEIVLAKK